MKIFIGPYLHWFGPYECARLLKYIGVSKERCDKIAEWLPSGPFQWFHNLKNRNIKVKIHPYDLWSLDVSLAHVILPALRAFRLNISGYPGSLWKDDNKDNDDSSMNQWEAIIDKMIWSFENCIEDPKFPGLHNEELYNAMKEHENKVQEGIDLFAKYYRNLWN